MADPDTSTTYKPPPLPPGAELYKPPPLPPGATMYAGSTPSAAPEKVYYNDAGQPFTASGRPPPQPQQDTGYTSQFFPVSHDASGYHWAVPEVLAAPFRGMVKGGERAVGVGERGRDPLRPLDPDTMATVGSLIGSPLAGMADRGMLDAALAPGGRLTETVARSPDKDLLADYTRAVKPGIPGKRSSTQRDDYYAQVKSAISSIVDNKENLAFADETGRVTTGELPKSLAQFSDAIEQTKQRVFDQYNAKAMAADDQGALVSLFPVYMKLNEIVHDPVYQDLAPNVVKNTSDMVNTMMARGWYSPAEMQRAIRTLNEGLDAFYKNPSMETATRASVDARLASLLRERLDDAITKLDGPGYQELKNEYGALKAIERDVNNRVGVVARQEKGGGIFGRIADVGAIGEVLHGIVTLNVAPVIKGTLLKAVAERVKQARNPDNVIAKVFERAETQRTPRVRQRLPFGPVLFDRGQPSAPLIPDPAYNAIVGGGAVLY